MKITQINFDGDGDPETIALTATIEELNLINRVLYELSPLAINAIAAGYSDELASITSSLNSMVYCRYWEDGLDGAIGKSGVPLNDIVLAYLKKKEPPQ